ncbi:MAG: hypothetical protein ACE3L7_32725 [Candidatus Pristimantibacillus sp.]
MIIILDLPFTITTIFVVVAITLKLFRKKYLDAFFFGLFTGSFLVYGVSKYYGVVNATISFWPFISFGILYFIYHILGFIRTRKQKNLPHNFRYEDRSFLMGPTSMGRSSDHLKTIYLPLKLASEGHHVHYVNLTREGENLSSKINNDTSIINTTNLIVYHDKEKPQLIIEGLTRVIQNRIKLFDDDDKSIERLPEIYMIYEEANDDQYLFESLCSLINEYKNVLKKLKITFVLSADVISAEDAPAAGKLFS